MAGPLWVEGAEPGDALRVEIVDIQIVSAWVAWLPQFGPLGSMVDGGMEAALAVVPDPRQGCRITRAGRAAGSR